ncbi:kinesin-like protein KIN-13A [Lolium rigidum]|uniref:kinesin-like protein KIN-13A n=1 Tax=Lolium rigidum TaxID=89674 RepID=UPI001F5C1A02|nr:kinesin-like protein KIN-13A [Lolium rigidum]
MVLRGRMEGVDERRRRRVFRGRRRFRFSSDCQLQGYEPQSIEEKQKLYMLFRSLNFNGESASAPISEPYTPTSQSIGGHSIDEFYSPKLGGEFGAGLLDLHAMDDSELLSENVASEPFEASTFVPKETDDDEDDVMSGSQQGL